MLKGLVTFGAGAFLGAYTQHRKDVITGYPGPLWPEEPLPEQEMAFVTIEQAASIFQTGQDIINGAKVFYENALERLSFVPDEDEKEAKKQIGTLAVQKNTGVAYVITSVKAGVSATWTEFDPRNIKLPLALSDKLRRNHRETQILSCLRRIEYWLQPGRMSHLHYVGGMNWYRQAHAFATQLAATYDFSMRQSAGVISAVSPGVPWDTNKRTAELVMHNYRMLEEVARVEGITFEGSDLDDPHKVFEGPLTQRMAKQGKKEIKLSYPIRFKRNATKGWEILAGRDTIASRSPGALKRERFATNIEQPQLADPVTVDIWAWRAAVGVMTAEQKACLDALELRNVVKLPGTSRYVYELYEEAYQRAARKRGILGHQAQAIVWVVIRSMLEPIIASRDASAADLFFAEIENTLTPNAMAQVKSAFSRIFRIYGGEEPIDY